MKFRLFYAPQVFKTWEKLFILTNDGNLHCQYLMRFEISKIEKNNIDYENFRATDYSWGKGVEGDSGIAFSNYQDCKKELTWEEYKNLEPSSLLSGYKRHHIDAQIRWVEDYISELGLTPDDWDDRFVNN